MAKSIKNILANIELNVEKSGLSPELLSLVGTTYVRQENATRTVNLSVGLTDVISALKTVNSKLNKLAALEKRVAVLEKKKK